MQGSRRVDTDDVRTKRQLSKWGHDVGPLAAPEAVGQHRVSPGEMRVPHGPHPLRLIWAPPPIAGLSGGRPSVRRPAQNHPLLGLTGDLGDELEVGVVVQDDEAPSLSGGGHQPVDE